MPDTTPSAKAAKGARRAERKRRRELERRREQVQRSRTITGWASFVALALAVALFLAGQSGPATIALIISSSLLGLYLGATIRLIRERRKLEDNGR